jgi:hypothetical protein
VSTEAEAAKKLALGELTISTCEIEGHASHAARITVDYGLQVTSFCLPPEHAAFLGDVLASETQAAARERESIALQMEGLAANYPETVFPAASDTRDGISGAAMRYAYQTAARLIRERAGLPS